MSDPKDIDWCALADLAETSLRNAEVKEILRWAMSLCAAGQPTGMIYGQLKKKLEEMEK